MDAHYQESSTEPGLMNVHEVAKYLRFCEAKVYKMSQQGIIPAIRIGKSWRFRKDLIDEWIRREAGNINQARA
jgi:excisionase family DNA binding protein